MTDEKLRLAPKVAEVMGPHKLVKGDWYLNEYDPFFGDDPACGGYVETSIHCYPSPHCPVGGTNTWLPTLEQCLDWLRERVAYLSLEWEIDSWEIVWWGEDEDMKVEEGQAALELAYRAVIAVGEGEK